MVPHVTAEEGGGGPDKTSVVNAQYIIVYIGVLYLLLELGLLCLHIYVCMRSVSVCIMPFDEVLHVNIQLIYPTLNVFKYTIYLPHKNMSRTESKEHFILHILILTVSKSIF